MPLPPYAPLHLHAKVDDLVAPYLAAPGTVGLVVGVLLGDERHVFGYGRIAADRDGVPDENTVFEIGSVTKVFTSALLADMIAREEVQLRDPVRKFLPDTVTVPTYHGDEISLYHLATHTSSLPRLPPNFDGTVQDESNPYAHFTVEHLYQALPLCKLRKPLGTHPDYSNLAVGLLGHVLARHRGRSYEEALTERVLTPLGLDETTIALSAAQQTRLARGHNGEGKPVANWDLPTLAGAGALRSTVADMLIFLEANLHPAKSKIPKVLEATHTAYPLPRPPYLLRYATAAGLAAAGLAAQWATGLARDGWPFTAIGAIAPAVSGFLGGLGPGVLTALLTAAGGRLLWPDDYPWPWAAGVGVVLATALSLRHWYPPREVALGWLLDRTNKSNLVHWHNGATGGYHSWLGFVQDSECGVVVLSNSDHSVDDIGRGVLDYAHQLNEVWAHVPRTHHTWNRQWGG